GTIEFHPHAWSVDGALAPDHIVFDLDPGPPAGLRAAAEVAVTIAQRLRAVGLLPVVKTSGSLGLHVAARLDENETFERTKAFGRRLAEELSARSAARIGARSD